MFARATAAARVAGGAHVTIDADAFYGHYHGQTAEHLRAAVEHLRGAAGARPLIWLAGVRSPKIETQRVDVTS